MMTVFIDHQNMKQDYYEKMLAMPPDQFYRKIIVLIKRFPEHVKDAIGETNKTKIIGLLEKEISKTDSRLDLDHRPCSIMKWTNAKGELSLHFIMNILCGTMKPLGAAYDSVIGFLFTGNNKIYRCDEDGGNGEPEVLVNDAVKPSAITIIKNGERFAFLDGNGIHIYDVTMKSHTILVPIRAGGARGLCFLEGDLLVTANRRGNQLFITGFDPLSGQTITSTEYGHQGSPCFMAAHKNRVFVTDLVLRRLSIFCTDAKKNLIFHISVDLRGPQMTKKFMFPSGIVVDKRGEVIIVEANAVNGFMMHGNALLEDWQEVEVKKNNKKQPFPYTAAIAVSPSGYLLASCRRSDTIKLFKFGEVVEETEVDMLIQQMATATTEDEHP